MSVQFNERGMLQAKVSFADLTDEDPDCQSDIDDIKSLTEDQAKLALYGFGQILVASPLGDLLAGTLLSSRFEPTAECRVAWESQILLAQTCLKGTNRSLQVLIADFKEVYGEKTDGVDNQSSS